MQGGAHGRGRGVGAEVAVAVAQPPPGDHHPRPFLAGGHLDERRVLVVAEDDVVARPLLLDERGLEDERLFLGGGEDGLHPVHAAEHDRGFGVGRAAVVGVLGEPLAQVAGLAHVEHLGAAEHLVDARAVTDRCEEFGGERAGRSLGLRA